MDNFYSTLLAIDIGVFSVMIAAILVHLEMVTSQYSYRAPHLLVRRNAWFWAAVVVFTLAISTAGVGFLRVSFPSTDLIPFVYLNSSSWADKPWFLFVSCLLSAAGYLLSFIVIYRYLGYFPVRNVIRTVQKRIQWEDVKLFLLSEYGMPQPRSLPWIQLFDNSSVEEEQLTDLHRRIEERVRKKQHDNPFALLLDAASAAIVRHDLEGWRVAARSVREKYIELFECYLKDADNNLLRRTSNKHLGTEIVRQLRFLTELADQEGHSSFAMDLIDIAGETAEAAGRAECLEVVGKAIIDDYIELEAERALAPGKESRLENALEAITRAGQAGVMAPTHDLAHSAIRSIGKLAEAYIHSGRSIPRSYIVSRQLQDEKPANSLSNAFWQFSHTITTGFADKLALEYWVYLSVTAEVVEEFVGAMQEGLDYSGIVSSLLHDVQVVALEAAGYRDAKALERACYYLGRLYRFSDDRNDPAEICETIGFYFAELGSQASAANIRVDVDVVDILGLPEELRTLTGIILWHMVTNLSSEHLRAAMNKAADDAMPPHGVDQLISEFIFPASKLADDDFGLSFHWQQP